MSTLLMILAVLSVILIIVRPRKKEKVDILAVDCADDTPTIKTTVEDLSPEEYSRRCLASRTDPARSAWKQEPEKYQRIQGLSTTEICPYCRNPFRKKKPPSRRSRFSCKSCGEVIHADPWQRIFPTVYLTEKEALVARYLGQLGTYGHFAASTEDFWWQAQQKAWTRDKEQLSASEAADVLWGLFNYNVAHLYSMLPDDQQEFAASYSHELQRLMSEYRQREKSLQDRQKATRDHSRKTCRNSAKIELICPYCNNSLGFVPRPSRASRRKCKKCAETIHVNPHPGLFPGPFLSDKQAFLNSILCSLDGWVFSRGSLDDFHVIREELGLGEELAFGQIVAILRELLFQNIEEAKARGANEKEEYLRLVGPLDQESDEDDRVFFYESTLIENLLEQFEEETATWDIAALATMELSRSAT